MCACDHSTRMDAFSGKLGKSSVDGDSSHRLLTESLQIPFPTQPAKKQLQRTGRLPVMGAVTHPGTAGLEGRGVPLRVWGPSPALQRRTQTGAGAPSAPSPPGSSSSQCARHVPTRHGEPRRRQGALSACSTANTHGPRGCLEKTIDPLRKAILGPPKQHRWLVPRGVSLRVGGEQLPVPPGPPQKGAGHQRGGLLHPPPIPAAFLFSTAILKA